MSFQEIASVVAGNLAKNNPYLDREEKYYTYVLLDPREPGEWKFSVRGIDVVFGNKPFYVGKGSGRRIHSHVSDAIRNRPNRSKVNPHKESVIRKIHSEGLAIIEEKFGGLVNEGMALAAEILLIEAIGRNDLGSGFLTNKTDGGEGSPRAIFTPEMKRAKSERVKGTKHSEETKKKLRQIKTGTKHTPEAKAKVSAALTGRTLSEATRQKISESNLGRKVSDESKEKMRKPKSDEARANMSKAAKKRAPISEETRKKLVDGLKKRVRKPWSDEARARMSARLKKDFAEGRKPSNKYIKEAENGI